MSANDVNEAGRAHQQRVDRQYYENLRRNFEKANAIRTDQLWKANDSREWFHRKSDEKQEKCHKALEDGRNRREGKMKEIVKKDRGHKEAEKRLKMTSKDLIPPLKKHTTRNK